MTRGEQRPIGSFLHHTTFYFVYALFTAALSPFQFGFHLAELNTPQAVITCEKESIKSTGLKTRLPQCIPMNTSEFAVVSSIYTLGGFLGALVAGPASSKYGRLLCMRIMTFFFVLGPALEASATNIGAMILGRLVSGVGAGAATVVVPIYISEISPPDYRGLFGTTTQVMICFGIFVTQLMGFFLSYGNMWRTILATAGVIGILQFVGLLLVPESPKWLAERGKLQIARDVLQKIRGRDVSIEEEIKSWNIRGSADEFAEEEALLATSPNGSSKDKPGGTVGIFQALTDSYYRPAVIAVVAVMATQQLTGINSIVMYSVSTLSALLPTTAALLTVLISVLNMVATTVFAPLSDKLGRKTCLLLSIAGMGINSILLAIGMGKGVKPLTAIASLLFVASFSVGLGPIPFILASELVGPEAVGAAQSWALASNWIATFVVSQFFPILNQAMGEKGRAYIVFAALAVVLGLFIAWWVPETKGKKDLDEVWGRKESRERLE